jgi:predicted pyridoxine 5'-phosphate oxidase superfamily flavin-nucleotide-binding protein
MSGAETDRSRLELAELRQIVAALAVSQAESQNARAQFLVALGETYFAAGKPGARDLHAPGFSNILTPHPLYFSAQTAIQEIDAAAKSALEIAQKLLQDNDGR